MSKAPINRDDVELCALLYAELGSRAKVAAELEKPESWVQRRLIKAAEQGLFAAPAKTPPGFVITGQTTLYGADGAERLTWVKTHRDQNEALIAEAIEAEFERYEGFSIPQTTKGPVEESLTLYAIGDHHLGLYSWWKETGQSFDVDIAEKALLDCMGELVQSTPASKLAVVLNLGDFFHSDSDENRTRRSGNILDTDTRYARVLQVGVRLMIATTDMALSKHQNVIIRNTKGNHDPYATLALTVALKAFYANNPRVFVDASPAPFWVYRYGKTLIVSTHGDMAKPAEIPGIVAAYFPADWGASFYRYALLGHVHSRNLGGERHGLIWESFGALAGKDAWHREMGYASNRSITAVTYSPTKGETSRRTVNVNGAEFAPPYKEKERE